MSAACKLRTLAVNQLIVTILREKKESTLIYVTLEK